MRCSFLFSFKSVEEGMSNWWIDFRRGIEVSFCVFTLKRLILYNYPIADINECAVDNGGCQDQCCNTIGSYFCRCQAGQKLEEDGRGCEGTSGDCLLTEKETEYLYNSKRGVAFHPSQLKHLC